MEEDVERIVVILLTMFISFVASNIIVDQLLGYLSTVHYLLAWLALTVIIFLISLAMMKEWIMEILAVGGLGSMIVLLIVSALLSALVVTFLPAILKIVVMIAIAYGLLRVFAPDVLKEVREVMESGR